jgi:hypothetical protein
MGLEYLTELISLNKDKLRKEQLKMEKKYER